jgi:glycosyltransferase involved in cell wall biosynthesis
VTPVSDSIPLVIPAFRPPAALLAVIRSVTRDDPDGLVAPIIVVNDGSGAAAADLFAAAAHLPRVILVARAANGGQGAALKAGMRHALRLMPNLPGVVTADADGQHAPADILNIARAFAEHPDRFILGVRQFGHNVPLCSRFGNILTRRLVSWTAGLTVSDTQTGLRAWPRRCCERNVQNPANRFDFNLATLLDAALSGDAPVEIPIATIYEASNRSSHFRPLQDSIEIYGALARHVARRLRG